MQITEGIDRLLQELTKTRLHKKLVVAVGHVNMPPEHLVDNVNRVMAHLKRLLKENPKDVHTFHIKSRSGPTVKLC
ncbi:hypothetical protein HPB49_018589 [Dermacentor silvarum]|uniref:Uncharacterized protein n=1 Tax=Dermacentor silvarum TaxID=543639 RepID=A0ACB8CGU5_DERSI|nr:hypothetical protein HPB49_018589 [Dermacentor silvarum]